MYAAVAIQGMSDRALKRSGSREQLELAANEARSSTIRVGSTDGCYSIHRDAKQDDDIVLPLADHFYVGGFNLPARALQVVCEHMYTCTASSEEAHPLAAPDNSLPAESLDFETTTESRSESNENNGISYLSYLE